MLFIVFGGTGCRSQKVPAEVLRGFSLFRRMLVLRLEIGYTYLFILMFHEHLPITFNATEPVKLKDLP